MIPNCKTCVFFDKINNFCELKEIKLEEYKSCGAWLLTTSQAEFKVVENQSKDEVKKR